MSARSARRPVPAIVFLLALAVLAVVVWVRVTDRSSSASDGPATCATAPQLPANAAVTVTVLNGTDKTGLATSVLQAFQQAGFAGGNVDNADTKVPGVASISYGPNGGLSALLVSYYLPGSTFTQDNRQDISVTVTVGAGYTALAAPAAVTAAEAKASVSQTPPASPPATPAPGAAGATSPAKPAATPTATCTTTPPAPTPSGAAAPAGTPGAGGSPAAS